MGCGRKGKPPHHLRICRSCSLTHSAGNITVILSMDDQDRNLRIFDSPYRICFQQIKTSIDFRSKNHKGFDEPLGDGGVFSYVENYI